MTELTPALRAALKTVSTATLCTALFKRGCATSSSRTCGRSSPTGTMVGEAFTLRYIPAREDLNPITVFQDRTIRNARPSSNARPARCW
jgi:regulator of RNase E activity RraA